MLNEITDYQAKYLAHEITRRWSSEQMGKFAAVVAGAQVDLNPHQVDAALFAFKSPLSQGAILADEVGLGKTIEAGILLSQQWAERKKRILIITPSNLRKQWHQELAEKFFLPSVILEARSYKMAQKQGEINPFSPKEPSLVICSYHFARNKEEDVLGVPWDLVVIDEAHRLRNVYKPNNVIANKLRTILHGRKKVLLTATPLQNSLKELYGLISFIDEKAFGDVKSFNQQFGNLKNEGVFDSLRERLAPFCHRTLRRQVVQYVPYTARHAILEEFTPDSNEQSLYDLVSDYLQRDELNALPSGQRALMTLVLRKLLASSTYAIAGALETMARRLQANLNNEELKLTMEETLDQDYESLDEVSEEWDSVESEDEPLTEEEKESIRNEIIELQSYSDLAHSLTHNAKGNALLLALEKAFQKTLSLGASEKAIIFTESRKTQNYLVDLLSSSKWAEGLVLFNGSNNDSRSRAIYENWKAAHEGTEKVTGSRTADMRSAIVDYFRNEGSIMIATEAGAEGINLQFCSLIINYDLPWNPQRVEQRIGRCHRYGQKHDVVVVNFLNKKNAADQRVYQLLSEKFQLFEGVFGASDEVLGAIGSGVDFEKRIAGIYQECRDEKQIKDAFEQLQLEFSQDISEELANTRKKLLENFDDEVREKLKQRDEESKQIISEFDRKLIRLTMHELGNSAELNSDSSFDLLQNPFTKETHEGIITGRYELPRQSGNAFLYRLDHPLAQAVITQAQRRELPPASLIFSYNEHAGQISIIEEILGQSGFLKVSLFTVDSLDQTEDYIILSAFTDSGHTLDHDTAHRLLSLPASVESHDVDLPEEKLERIAEEERNTISREISERNAHFFEEEAKKLDGWADDLKVGLEREVKELDKQIKEMKRSSSTASTLEEKLAAQKDIKRLENIRKEKRRSLYDAQDAIDEKRDDLISNIEGKLKSSSKVENLFSIHWALT